MRYFAFCIMVWLVMPSFGQTAAELERKLSTIEGTEKVKTLNLLFGAWIDQDPVRASGYAREALALANEVGDTHGMAAAYNNLGVVYRNHGALDKALEFYITAEGLFRKTNDKPGLAATHNNIGTVYSLKKDAEKAKGYFEDATKLFRELNDTIRLIGALNNLGNVTSEVTKHQEGLKFFEEAVILGERSGLSSPDPLINIGTMFLRKREHEKAVEYLNRAAGLATGMQKGESLLSIKIGLGNAWLSSGNLKASEKALLEALDLSEQLQAYVYEPEIYKTLAVNFASQNRMREAYDNMLKFEQSRERIFSEESGKKIAQMEMLIDIHEKEKEIERLKKDEAIQAIELQRTRLAITLIVISILTAVLLINYILQKRKASKK